MFFSGDPSSKKRVNLGGRSSRESDRDKLLEQARLERLQRSKVKQQNTAALKIQVPVPTLRLDIIYYYLVYDVMFSFDCSTITVSLLEDTLKSVKSCPFWC